jgi:hypothetical protein
MTNKILVTYATCTGSTVGVAEAIGKSLAEGGAQVDVLPMQAVKELGPTRPWWPAAPFMQSLAARGRAVRPGAPGGIEAANPLRHSWCA